MSQELQSHTLTAVGLPQLLSVVAQYGVSPAYLPRLASLAFSSAVAAPLRWLDIARSSSLIARSTIDQPPLFVVGHPRSGTTYLHNLLCRDERFGCATTLHCAATELFLGAPKMIRLAMERLLPETRPMDNVKVGLDEPQEEEMAMARISPLSFNHGLHFPNQMRRVFDRSVLFQPPSSGDRERWKKTYLWFLKRVSLDQGHRPLCLKSPPNMARLPVLLELFPDARFIHIYRNPYEVYVSVVRLWRKVLPALSLQSYQWEQVEENLVYFFQQMVQRYYEDCAQVPHGQLAEVRFEDLEREPLGELQRLYGELNLGNFGRVRGVIEDYLRSLGDYRKNTYAFEEPQVTRVEEAWGFALRRWGYARPAA